MTHEQENSYHPVPPMTHTPTRQPGLPYLFTKRLTDILISFFGLLLLSPLFLLVAVLLKREQPGCSVFYRGPRLGRGGQPFAMLKFRTMLENGSPNHRVTACDDERITPLGRWLRDTKLNELPQLWNVLVGEMSLVGPRPEDPEIASHWPEAVRETILSVRPGITSPASVLYQHEEQLLTGDSFMDDYLNRILPDKLRLDYLYVRSRSILTDIDIFFLTLVALLPRVRTTPLPEKVLFWGPLSTFINRYFSWFMADILIALLAVGISGIIRRMSGPLDLGWERASFLAIGIALICSLSNLTLGLGKVSWKQARPAYVLELAFSCGLATLVVFLLNWYWPGGSLLPRGFMINIGIMCFMLFVAARYRERLFTGLASRWLTGRHRNRSFGLGERVLIVGAGECGQLAAWLLKKSKFSTPYTIIGLVDDDPRKQGQTIDRYPVLGQTREIPDLVTANDVGLILFAINEVTPAERERILAVCSATTAHLVIIPDLLEYFHSQLSGDTVPSSIGE